MITYAVPRRTGFPFTGAFTTKPIPSSGSSDASSYTEVTLGLLRSTDKQNSLRLLLDLLILGANTSVAHLRQTVFPLWSILQTRIGLYL